jgi:hypothetical protein
MWGLSWACDVTVAILKGAGSQWCVPVGLLVRLCRTAHFMKVKAAIEKEYWLLMLSQPRPAPKLAEPPLARLSHFVYNGDGGNSRAGGAGDPADGTGDVVQPLLHSGGTGLGEWHGVEVISNACDTALCEAC